MLLQRNQIIMYQNSSFEAREWRNKIYWQKSMGSAKFRQSGNLPEP
jgi:hypothetical protein